MGMSAAAHWQETLYYDIISVIGASALWLSFIVVLLIKGCGLYLTVLPCYDYLLTLDDEIRCIWRQKFTAMTATFMTMRYATLVYAISMGARVGSCDPERHVSILMPTTLLINLAHWQMWSVSLLAVQHLSGICTLQCRRYVVK